MFLGPSKVDFTLDQVNKMRVAEVRIQIHPVAEEASLRPPKSDPRHIWFNCDRLE